MKNIYLKILKLQHAGHQLVLATVAGSIGSTPQKPGSSALFDGSRLIAGTVGGGTVESRVQNLAQTKSKTKESCYLKIQLNNNISDKEAAICGGEISVLMDANPEKYLPVFEEIKVSMAEKIPGILITMVTVLSEDKVIVDRYWMTNMKKPSLDSRYLNWIEPEVKNILAAADPENFKQMKIALPGKKQLTLFLLEPIFPLPQLYIAGAGHIGKALSHLGKMLDFEVTIIDDRQEYANSDNLPDADHVIVQDIGEAVEKIEKKHDTFIVIVTRGHNDDAKALKPCIGSDAGYVGMIGSKGKVAKMHAEFIQQGWATEEQWNRVYTPIGLDIRSKTVEEIAISIAAQLVQVRNKKR
jgi:xanthine dehydrogenase accessory factor